MSTRIGDKIREIGLIYTARRALWRIVPRWLFSIENAVICEVPMAPLAEALSDDAEARWDSMEDLAALTAFGSTPAELKARFARGARPGIIEHDGRVVAWNWIEPRYHDQWDWLRIRLTDTCIWSFDGWVLPELRGRRLFPRVKTFMARECAADGIVRMVSLIDLLNRNQIRSNQSIGGRIVGALWAVRLLGLTLHRLNGDYRFGWWGFGRRLELPVAALFRRGPGLSRRRPRPGARGRGNWIPRPATSCSSAP